MISNLESILQSIPEIQLAIVYGSFAAGTQRPDSDLDLAIAGARPFTDDFKVDLVNRLSGALKREIDLIDLNVASGTVLKEALTNGKVIKKVDSDLLGRVLKKMLFDEADFQIVRRKYLAQRRKKVFDVG